MAYSRTTHKFQKTAQDKFMQGQKSPPVNQDKFKNLILKSLYWRPFSGLKNVRAGGSIPLLGTIQKTPETLPSANHYL
jgi:hypothetical protein